MKIIDPLFLWLSTPASSTSNVYMLFKKDLYSNSLTITKGNPNII